MAFGIAYNGGKQKLSSFREGNFYLQFLHQFVLENDTLIEN